MAQHFLDGSVASSGNGLTWGTAWKTLANITGLAAGDTVFISGGATASSQTYTVPSGGWSPAGGSAGNPIIYQTGQDASHNGTVIIDGGGGQWLINPANTGNFTISGFVSGISLTPTGPPNGLTDLNPRMRFQNNGDTKVYLNWTTNVNITFEWISAPDHDRFIYCVNGSNVTGLTVRYCYLRKVPDQSAINGTSSNGDDTFFLGGLGGNGFAQGAVFHHCYILNVLSTGNSAYGDDVFKWGDNFDVHHCHLATYQDSRYLAQEPNQHCDIFQNAASYCRVWSNWFENIGESVYFHDVFGATAGHFNDVYFYNNVITQTYVQPYAQVDRGLDFEPQDQPQQSTFTRVIIANNFWMCPQTSIFVMRFHQAISWTDCHVVNNIFYRCGGGIVTDAIAGAQISMSNNPTANSSGVDFVSPGTFDYHLASGSTLINSGTSFPSAYFTTDKDGVTRPQGAGWDVGPYEFGGVSDTTAPSVPTGLQATGVQSTQITIGWNPSTDNVTPQDQLTYQVYQGSAGGLLGTTSAGVTSFTQSGLTPTTQYHYNVKARDGAGNLSAFLASDITPATLTGTTGAPVFPVKVNPTHRYVVDQNNVPFMMIADSPWGLMTQLALTGTNSMATFMQSRQTLGFNSFGVYLVNNQYGGGPSNAHTFDGLAPFNTTAGTDSRGNTIYDISTPNASYWARVDAMIAQAASYGLMVLAFPMETGGWLETMVNQGTTKCTNYGIFIGNRYKAVPNILWCAGDDYQTWSTAGNDTVVLAVTNGIKSVDINHIHTVQLDFINSSSFDDSNWTNVINVNSIYTYFPTYEQMKLSYQASPTTPTLMVENSYEGEQNTNTDAGSSINLRKGEWGSMLAGGTGHLFGNHYLWGFLSGWPSNLATTGATQFGYVGAFFDAINWQNLVPDFAHTFLTVGFGTEYTNLGASTAANTNTNDTYAPAGVDPGGTVGVVYMPSSRAVTINMTKMSGSTKAQWFDPTNNTFSTVSGSPFPNTGTHVFTPVGNNGDGQGDWVLLLTQAAASSLPISASLKSSSVIKFRVRTKSLGSLRGNSLANFQVSSSSIRPLAIAHSVTAGSLRSPPVNVCRPKSIGALLTTGDENHQTSSQSIRPHAIGNAITFLSVSPPALAQGRAGHFNGTGQASISLAYAGAQTAGNCNVVFTVTSVVPPEVSDSKGNNYQLIAAGNFNYAFVATDILPALPGANVVTVTFFPTQDYPNIQISEFSDIDPLSALDGFSTIHFTGTDFLCPPITTSQSGAIVSWLNGGGNPTTFVGPGFTFIVSDTPGSWNSSTEYQITGAGGSYSSEFFTSVSTTSNMLTVALKADLSPTISVHIVARPRAIVSSPCRSSSSVVVRAFAFPAMLVLSKWSSVINVRQFCRPKAIGTCRGSSLASAELDATTVSPKALASSRPLSVLHPRVFCLPQAFGSMGCSGLSVPDVLYKTAAIGTTIAIGSVAPEVLCFPTAIGFARAPGIASAEISDTSIRPKALSISATYGVVNNTVAYSPIASGACQPSGETNPQLAPSAIFILRPFAVGRSQSSGRSAYELTSVQRYTSSGSSRTTVTILWKIRSLPRASGKMRASSLVTVEYGGVAEVPEITASGDLKDGPLGGKAYRRKRDGERHSHITHVSNPQLSSGKPPIGIQPLPTPPGSL